MNSRTSKQQNRERVALAIRLLDRHPELRPEHLPASSATRAAALRACDPCTLEQLLEEAVVRHLRKHPGAADLMMLLGIIEMGRIPMPLSVLSVLVGAEEHEVAGWVKELEELGLVLIGAQSGSVSASSLLDRAGPFALGRMTPFQIRELEAHYFTNLAVADAEGPEDSPFVRTIRILRQMALERFAAGGDASAMTPRLAAAYVEFAIAEGNVIAQEGFPHAEDAINLARELVRNGTVPLNPVDALELTRTAALLHLRTGEFDRALHLLSEAREQAAACDAEARLPIEAALMATLVEQNSPRAGDQILATIRLACEAGDSGIEEVARTIRFKWLCEKQEELRLLEEYDEERRSTRPREICLERQVYIAYAQALHRDEKAGVAALKALAAKARKSRHPFLHSFALSFHAIVEDHFGRPANAAKLLRKAVDVAKENGRLAEAQVHLATLAGILARQPFVPSAIQAERIVAEGLALCRSVPPNEGCKAALLESRARANLTLFDFEEVLRDCHRMLSCANAIRDFQIAASAYSLAAETHQILDRKTRARKCALLAAWAALQTSDRQLKEETFKRVSRLVPDASVEERCAMVESLGGSIRDNRFPPP